MANEVLNLGSAVYGTLGWTPVNDITQLSRSNNPYVGSMSMLIDSDGVNSQDIRAVRTPEGTEAPEIDPSKDVTLSFWFSYNSIFPVWSRFIWLDASGGEIGRSTDEKAESPNPAVDDWRQATMTRTPPANARRVAVEIEKNRSPALYIDAVNLNQHGITDYVPSLRVREDLEIEIEGLLFNVAGTSRLISRGDDVDSRSWYLNVGWGTVSLKRFLADDNSDSNNVNVDTELETEEMQTMKFNYRSSDGQLTVFVDGQQVGTEITNNFFLNDAPSSIRVGVLTEAIISRVVVRDGVAGQVIFDWNAEDYEVGDTEFQMGSGLTARLLGNTEIVKDSFFRMIDGHVQLTVMPEIQEWYVDGALSDVEYISESPVNGSETFTWIAGFTQPLGSSKRASLESWSGGLEDEPHWLRNHRPLAVYLNANDDRQRAFMRSDDFVNLTNSLKYRKRDDDGTRAYFYVSSNNRARFTAGNV